VLREAPEELTRGSLFRLGEGIGKVAYASEHWVVSRERHPSEIIGLILTWKLLRKLDRLVPGEIGRRMLAKPGRQIRALSLIFRAFVLSVPRGIWFTRHARHMWRQYRWHETRGRKLADAVKLTPAEERAFGGSVPALLSFFNIVQQTPGLNAILFDILDLPPMWSLVRHGGVNSVNFRFQPYQVAAADATPWGLPAETPVYHFPMVLELDRHPALNLTLVVTPAHPPLLACAGIVGMLVERPGDQDTCLTLRVLSARRSNGKL